MYHCEKTVIVAYQFCNKINRIFEDNAGKFFKKFHCYFLVKQDNVISNFNNKYLFPFLFRFFGTAFP